MGAKNSRASRRALPADRFHAGWPGSDGQRVGAGALGPAAFAFSLPLRAIRGVGPSGVPGTAGPRARPKGRGSDALERGLTEYGRLRPKVEATRVRNLRHPDFERRSAGE